MGHPQSGQWSDQLDQKYGIWNDIFLNFHDLHRSFSGPNDYGPILFCLDAQKLLTHIEKQNLQLSITKKQPHHWKPNDKDSERWLSSLDGLFPHPAGSEKQAFTSGWPDIVIGGAGTGLPLSMVSRIIIDIHPTVSTFTSQLKSIAENCLKGHGLAPEIYGRKFCKAECKCKKTEHITEKKLGYKYASDGWAKECGKIA